MEISPFVITFSGDPVSGKSSASKLLARKYEKEGFFIGERSGGQCVIRLESGKIFRALADKAGISVNALNEFAMQSGNTLRMLRDMAKDKSYFDKLGEDKLLKTIDSFIDEDMLRRINKLKVRYTGVEDVIIMADTRMAGLLMKSEGQDNMSIRFSIQPEIAAERLLKAAKSKERKGELNLDGTTEEEAYDIALESLKTRTSVERERFIKIYSKNIFDQAENSKVDLQNLDNYDLVIDTSGTTIDREVDVLYDCIEKARQGQKYNKRWASTKYIYPGSVVTEKVDATQPPKIKAIDIDGQLYALHGQEYVGVANHMGYKIEQQSDEESGYVLAPVEIVAKKDQFVFEPDENGDIKGFQAGLYIERNITEELVENFEHDYNFKYPRRGLAILKSLREVIAEKREHFGPDR